MNWHEWGVQAAEGRPLSFQQALFVLQAPDDDLLAVLDAAFVARRRWFGRRVNLHILKNAKSGGCSEDCSFCSQSASSGVEIERYDLVAEDELVEDARRARERGAAKYCMVTSGREPSAEELERVVRVLRRIKAESPRLQLCCSLGLLSPAQAQALKAAGADRINHNLETSRRHYPALCRTHTYDDRLRTLQAARAAGLELCCGGLVGAGETAEDRVELALAVRELQAHSIPVNFFNPRPGTPLAGLPPLGPGDALRALAMFRLVNPAADIRAAGGREAILRELQPLALYAASSIFTEGYLTTGGQGGERDLAMIRTAGFTVATLEE